MVHKKGCDASLLAAVADGDSHALARLYLHEGDRLRGIALRILRDPADAEDLLHDVFLQVAARASQYVAARGSVSGWITALTRNLSLDRLRARVRQRGLREKSVEDHPHAPVATPEALLTSARERARVRRELLALRDVERETLHSAFYDEHTYAEVAEIAHVPLGTVKSRAHRGLSALRASLERG